MLYYLHEMHRMSMAPARAAAEMMKLASQNPLNPVARTYFGRVLGSAADVFEHQTRRYGKPDWGIAETIIDGRPVAVTIEPIIQRTWCNLLHFKRDTARNDPKLLVVAPYSGHFATLIRGTVERLLPEHDVYVTDWADARMVPISEDKFNFFDYVDYIIDFLHFLGGGIHVVAICQPAVPVLAAVGVMSGWGDSCVPATMSLIGGPIDTRKSATAVNILAQQKPIEWFERHVVVQVPPPYPGMYRQVYPGFIQLTNFISMNLDKHIAAMHQLFDHLVAGDSDAAERKRSFYEEYLAVLDLPAEFYLSTVKMVFQDHLLPKGEMMIRWHPVRLDKIDRTAILCIEGALDDISGVGQTKAALEITPNLPAEMKQYHLQEDVGHYGLFNGSKWRSEIAPVIETFIRRHDRAAPAERG